MADLSTVPRELVASGTGAVAWPSHDSHCNGILLRLCSERAPSRVRNLAEPGRPRDRYQHEYGPEDAAPEAAGALRPAGKGISQTWTMPADNPAVSFEPRASRLILPRGVQVHAGAKLRGRGRHRLKLRQVAEANGWHAVGSRIGRDRNLGQNSAVNGLMRVAKQYRASERQSLTSFGVRKTHKESTKAGCLRVAASASAINDAGCCRAAGYQPE